MATTEEMLATIDAKLSALLDVVVDMQARGRPGGAPAPSDLDAHAAALSAMLGDGATAPTPAPPPPVPPPAIAASGAELDELAKLLALSLVRKRDIEEAIVKLDAAGFEHRRIAELLGVNRGRVVGALERAARRGR